MALRKIVNGGFSECHIHRLLVDKFPADDCEANVRQPPEDIVTLRDALPYGLTSQLAGAFGWAGFGNCNCLGRQAWDQLRALRGIWPQEETDRRFTKIKNNGDRGERCG
jgi:hypothetical protein